MPDDVTSPAVPTRPFGPPQVAVFDLGKVLLDFDYRRAVGRLLPRVKVELAGIQRLLTESSLLSEYETGRLSTHAFYEQVAAATGFDGDLALFEAIFSDIFTEIEPMTAMLPPLKKAGVGLCAFSNTNELAIRYIRAHYPFFALFDHTVLSYEHGVMKPDARLYEIVEQHTGCRGAELLYFDDRPENVAAALARDWRAIHHTEPVRSVRSARDAGLPVT